MASAVSAITGTRTPVDCSFSRIFAVASNPPMRGMCTSMSTRSNWPWARCSSASTPSFATVTEWPRFWSMMTANFWLTMLSSASSTRRGAAGVSSPWRVAAATGADGATATGAATAPA